MLGKINIPRSVWEFAVDVPGDLVVVTLGWPFMGKKDSILEMFPHILSEEADECLAMHRHVQTKFKLTHFANGSPMIPARTIQKWYIYYMEKTEKKEPEEKEKLVAYQKEWLHDFLKHDLCQRHTSILLDLTDWYHFATYGGTQEQNIIQHFFQTIRHISPHHVIHVYAPCLALVKWLEAANMDGKEQEWMVATPEEC
jgi:hypothetical protein